ncbi:hypothetical protein Glove_205g10 [Diversispora epigaea]|uniref:Uncharacterized protein n=1 Tax=Diversispora epigaea TaxID=1348612 RepID=A0A397IMM8_9GLOM|nr:hypothetical protein Glove_205g10 [Diversispora epigaea]
MLPPISNVAKASEIAAWKKKLAVSNCFRKLFEKIEDDENDTYMTKIIKNVWPKKKNIPNLQIAWAISISEIFLNPKNEVIKMSEEIIQPALARNLRKIENEEGFEYESDSSPTPQRPVSPERQKDPEKQIEPERNKGKKRIIEVETLQKNLKKSKRKVENNEYEEMYWDLPNNIHDYSLSALKEAVPCLNRQLANYAEKYKLHHRIPNVILEVEQLEKELNNI